MIDYNFRAAKELQKQDAELQGEIERLHSERRALGPQIGTGMRSLVRSQALAILRSQDAGLEWQIKRLEFERQAISKRIHELAANRGDMLLKRARLADEINRTVEGSKERDSLLKELAGLLRLIEQLDGDPALIQEAEEIERDVKKRDERNIYAKETWHTTPKGKCPISRLGEYGASGTQILGEGWVSLSELAAAGLTREQVE